MATESAERATGMKAGVPASSAFILDGHKAQWCDCGFLAPCLGPVASAPGLPQSFLGSAVIIKQFMACSSDCVDSCDKIPGS